jgi:hypothetical protein
VYDLVPDYRCSEKGWLVYAKEKLYYRSTSFEAAKIISIDPRTLKVKFTFFILLLSPN